VRYNKSKRKPLGANGKGRGACSRPVELFTVHARNWRCDSEIVGHWEPTGKFGARQVESDHVSVHELMNYLQFTLETGRSRSMRSRIEH
jgi:hypothetical protein